MECKESLSKRFIDLFEGKWIANTNYNILLSDLSWKEATTPVKTLNTVAALCFHVNYYIEGLLEVFNGGDLTIKDQYSFDLDPVTDEYIWNKMVKTLLENSKKFEAHLLAMDEEQLDKPFVKPSYGSYRRNIEGLIEHSYYHMGQIAIIKKMIRYKEVSK